MSKAIKTVFDQTVTTASDALDKANMAWLAEASDLKIELTDKVSTLKKAIIRSDTKEELGIVGKKYQIIQNSEAFTLFDIICENNNAHYKSAIEVDDGRKVVLEAELNAEEEIVPGEIVKKGFYLINGFDGMHGLHAYFILKALKSNIILRAPSFNKGKTSNGISLKHTKNVDAKIKESFEVLNVSAAYFDKFIEEAKNLSTKMVEKAVVDTFLQTLIDGDDSKVSERKRSEIKSLFASSETQSAWELYCSVVKYFDRSAGKSDDKRLASNLFGSFCLIKEKAFKLLIDEI